MLACIRAYENTGRGGSPTPRLSNISNKFPGDVYAAGVGNMPRELLS